MKSSLILLCAIALAGCLEPSVEETKPPDAKSLADALVYVKARNGLCFGVGTTSRMDTGGNASFTNQIVAVQCSDVGL